MEDLLTNEIDELLDVAPAEPEAVASEPTEEPVQEPEPEAFDTPVEEPVEQSVEAPETPVEATSPEPEADTALSELEALRQQNTAMRELMNKIAGGASLVESPAPEQPEQPTQPGQFTPEQIAQLQALQQPQAPAQPAQPEQPQQFITEELYDKMMSSPQGMNEFMTAFAQEIQQQASNAAVAQAMQQIPEQVLPAMQSHATQQAMVHEWARQNEVVTQNAPLAQQILNQVDAHNPALPVEQKLAMTLDYLNTHLGAVPQPVQPSQQPVAQAPGVQSAAFAQPPRGSKPARPQVSTLQQEIDDLIG